MEKKVEDVEGKITWFCFRIYTLSPIASSKVEE